MPITTFLDVEQPTGMFFLFSHFAIFLLFVKFLNANYGAAEK